MVLTEQQNRILERIKEFMASDASVFILRGYAGTGKTTMIKVIADYILDPRQLFLMAPTGRAARVLQAKTKHYATTIHKTIYEAAAVIPQVVNKYDVNALHQNIYGTSCLVSKTIEDIAQSEFKFVFPIRKNEMEGNMVAIVDEASMICSRTIEHELFVFGTDNLMDDLLTFARLSFGGKIIFVGDPAQLPPVGESVSNALNADFFKARGLEVYQEELTEVLRQKKDSLILKNAMMIRDLLKTKVRNNLAFEEKKNDVESVASGDFLTKYIEALKHDGPLGCVLICYSNRAASQYNLDIRRCLYGRDLPIKAGDILLVIQNNYWLNRMNGEFIHVKAVGERLQQTAPVYAQVNGEKKRVIITLNFVQILTSDGDEGDRCCLLLEDLLGSDKMALSIDENRAMYINFCMRNRKLKPGTREFVNKLMEDPFYNAIRAKFGYAVTGHKCQGGEWNKVFVDYMDRSGLDNDSLRWAYTATTRAQQTLYITNLHHVTPFSKFRIDPIQKCKNIDPECRVASEVPTTPYHNEYTNNYLRAKYWCIEENMKGTPYRVSGVFSKPYMEIYQVQTPDGADQYTIYYKEGGVFQQAKPLVLNKHTQQVLLMLNDERSFPFVFSYQPSSVLHENLYNLIRSACDSLFIQLTNVVEHPEDFSVVYYMRTSGTFSYLKIYINAKGFVTYAKPMSILGINDVELKALLNVINVHLK